MYSLVYTENQESAWHRACITHEGTGRSLEGVLEAHAGEWAWWVSMLQIISQRERESEIKKYMGTQALMEQMCFNDLSMSIYRLLYKKFLSTMIQIRKPNVQQPLPREQGINNSHKVRKQSYLKKETKQLCGKENVYWRRFKPVSSYDLSPGSVVPFHSFLLPETDKEQRIY